MQKTFLLMVSVFLTLFGISTVSTAETSVWKISKEDRYFYLGGTVHLLNPYDYPLPDGFSTAYNDSEKLIFEADVFDEDDAELEQKFLTAMVYPDQRTLQDDLNEQTYADLKAYLADRGMRLKDFSIFQPWAISLTLTLIEYEILGMLPEYGVDMFFHQKAVNDQKSLGFLETVDEQITYLKSLATVEANEMIEYTLEDLAQLPDFIDLLKKSWRAGDVEAFMEHSSVAQMQSDYPKIYDALVIDRNNAWLELVAHLIDDAPVEFVLVGALHLSGEQGLLAQLKNLGFEAEQL